MIRCLGPKKQPGCVGLTSGKGRSTGIGGTDGAKSAVIVSGSNEGSSMDVLKTTDFTRSGSGSKVSTGATLRRGTESAPFFRETCLNHETRRHRHNGLPYCPLCRSKNVIAGIAQHSDHQSRDQTSR